MGVRSDVRVLRDRNFNQGGSTIRRVDGAIAERPRVVAGRRGVRPQGESGRRRVGERRVTGSVDYNETTGALRIDVREAYQNCVTTSSPNR